MKAKLCAFLTCLFLGLMVDRASAGLDNNSFEARLERVVDAYVLLSVSLTAEARKASLRRGARLVTQRSLVQHDAIFEGRYYHLYPLVPSARTELDRRRLDAWKGRRVRLVVRTIDGRIYVEDIFRSDPSER